MKRLNKTLAGLLFLGMFLSGLSVCAQDSTKGTLNISLNYFLENNTIPYVLVRTKAKIDGRFKPVSDIPLQLFLTKDSAGNKIGDLVTNENGEASTIIPPSLKSQWDASPGSHSFLVTFAGNRQFEASQADLAINRAKILLDTTADRHIVATLLGLKDTSWVPLKGIDVSIGISRMDADLSVNENATFTTDSLGQATAEFKRDSIPGDKNGNITLVAKVEDNDPYGNLSVEKIVPWGAKFTPVNNFNERTLFATRNKAPIWLLVIAYSIVILVWSILLYLVLNIFKLKRMGNEI